MGKKPDQIEREIKEHRDRISRKIDGLQGRIQDDVESMRSGAKQRASNAGDQAKQFLDINSQVEEHPYSVLASALGVGVLLGMASEGIGMGSGSNGR